MIPIYLAQSYDGYHNMMDGGNWGWGPLMMVFWVLIVAGVVVFIVRGTRHNHTVDGNKSEALEIAKRRYAKGEITKEEFEQFKKDLK